MKTRQGRQQQQLQNTSINNSKDDCIILDQTSPNIKLKLSLSSSSLSSVSSESDITKDSSSESSTQSSTSTSTHSAISVSSTKSNESEVNGYAGAVSTSTSNGQESTNKESTNEQQQEKPITKKCLWNKCGYKCSNDASLIDHIQSKHVFSQKTSKKYKCLWKGCRVYKAPSSSFNWLERHVVTHADTKPYSCIINGCKRKFTTQSSLERHVQCHMNIYESNSSPLKQQQKQLKSPSNPSANALSNPTTSSTSISLNTNGQQTKGASQATNCLNGVRRERKRKPHDNGIYKKAKYKDFFDEYSCKLVQKCLVDLNYNMGTLTFKPNVLQTKKYSDANYSLVEWQPKNILENEWIEENKANSNKILQIDSLKQAEFASKDNCLYKSIRYRSNKRK